MNCADGVGYIFDCPEGLAYNSETYRCDWPDQVADCDAEGKISLYREYENILIAFEFVCKAFKIVNSRILLLIQKATDCNLFNF